MNASKAPFPLPSPRPWVVLVLLFCISVVTYIDRVNISVTARQMMPALGLTDVEMGRVFSAFVLGYALFQIPGGWLGDRLGPRLVLTLAVVWWSVFTGLTAVAGSLPTAAWLGALGSLMLVRFLIGVGEAAAIPNFNRAVADWLPSHRRGFGISFAISGLGVGSALTPPVTAWVMVNYGWQTAFWGAAVLGLLVAALWYALARDGPPDRSTPVDGQGVSLGSHTETPRHENRTNVPWRVFAATPTIRWLVLSYSCLGYVAYIYLSWFYLYLVNVRGFGILAGAVYASAPFVAIALACPLGGWLTDRALTRWGPNRGRAAIGGAGMGLSSAAIGVGAIADSPYLAILFLSLGAGFLYLTVGAYWASTSDLSSRHAGTLSGIMNTGANLGGTLSPTVTPWLAQQWGWTAALGVAALVALIGGILWLWIRPGDGLHKPTMNDDRRMEMGSPRDTCC